MEERVRWSRGSAEVQTVAIAADHRHALRGAGAQEGDGQRQAHVRPSAAARHLFNAAERACMG